MLIFQHFRPVSEYLTIMRIFKPKIADRFSGDELLTLSENEEKSCLNSVNLSAAKSDYKINDIRVAIMDSKPIVIPLGKTGPSYKVKFKLFHLYDFNGWYTILANDVLKVMGSSLAEFEEGSYWDVDEITIDRNAGSPSARSLTSDEMEDLGYYTKYYTLREDDTGKIVDYWVDEEIPVGYSVVRTVERPSNGDQVIPWTVELVVYKNNTATDMEVFCAV